jgi:hypothetical protein
MRPGGSVYRPTRATHASTARHHRLPDGSGLQFVWELPAGSASVNRSALRPIFMVPQREGPHPRRSYGCGVRLEDASDHGTVRQHIEIILFHSPEGWEAETRLRMRLTMPPVYYYVAITALAL